MIYLQLFLAFVQIGAFSFGGGYAAMPLIQAQVIDTYHWLNAADFADLVTIAEMTPGPIAINAASFVGNQVAGVLGAVVATVSVALPSCIFVTILAILYQRYRKMTIMQGVLATLRPAVVSMIFAAGLTVLISALFADGTLSFIAGNFQVRSAIYFIIALFVLRKWKPNPILVMLGCGIAELIVRLILL